MPVGRGRAAPLDSVSAVPRRIQPPGRDGPPDRLPGRFVVHYEAGMRTGPFIRRARRSNAPGVRGRPAVVALGGSAAVPLRSTVRAAAEPGVTAASSPVQMLPASGHTRRYRPRARIHAGQTRRRGSGSPDLPTQRRARKSVNRPNRCRSRRYDEPVGQAAPGGVRPMESPAHRRLPERGNVARSWNSRPTTAVQARGWAWSWAFRRRSMETWV